MERLAILPYDDLTTKVAQASARLSDAARDALPDARMTAEVSDAGEGLAAKRIDVEVRWRARSGIDDAPVRLTSWVARKEDR